MFSSLCYIMLCYILNKLYLALLARTDAMGEVGRFTLPFNFQVLVVFWPLLKIFLKEHLNIEKTAKKQPHIFKNKKVMSIGKSWIILNFSNLLCKILDFPTLKIVKNLTDHHNHLKSFYLIEETKI